MNSYIYLAIATVVFTYTTIIKLENVELEDKLVVITKQLKTKEKEFSNCKVSISNQNKAISDITIDLQSKDKELEEWKSKPPKVKYETIYKEVVKDRVLKGDCDELKSIINDSTSINLNIL